jgi:hypothetical protein
VADDRERQAALTQARQSMLSPTNYESDSKRISVYDLCAANELVTRIAAGLLGRCFACARLVRIL